MTKRILTMKYWVTVEKEFNIPDYGYFLKEISDIEDSAIQSLDIALEQGTDMELKWDKDPLPKDLKYFAPTQDLIFKCGDDDWATDGSIVMKLAESATFGQFIHWRKLTDEQVEIACLTIADAVTYPPHGGVFDIKYCKPYLGCACFGLAENTAGYINRNGKLLAILMPIVKTRPKEFFDDREYSFPPF